MLWLFLSFLLFPWQPSQSQDRSCQYITSKTGRVLLNHVVANFPMIGLDECLTKCKTSIECKSWNYNFVNQLCQHNNMTHCSRPDDMEVDVDVAYMINSDFIYEC